MFMVEVAGMRCLYTGDYSRAPDRHMPVADVPTVPLDVGECMLGQPGGQRMAGADGVGRGRVGEDERERKAGEDRREQLVGIDWHMPAVDVAAVSR